MKIVKIVVIIGMVYVGIVIAFESLLGYFQPANQSTLVIRTTDASGKPHERVVARLQSNNNLYVAANHWPRGWYEQALENPAVVATFAGEQTNYTAVPVHGIEHDRVNSDNALGIGFRILTGFPPRYFVRLDPKPPALTH